MRKIIASLVVLTLAVIVFTGFMNKPVKTLITEGDRSFNERINVFGIEMVKNLDVFVSHQDFMISPLSGSIALSMVLNGALEDTKDEILHALHFRLLTNNEINSAYRDMSASLNDSTKNNLFMLSNSIWIREQFPVLKSFTETMESFYNTKVISLDFSNPTSVRKINKWVEKTTQGKIPKAVKNLKPEDMMVLINSVYFKGFWQSPFNPSKNIQMSFLNEGTGEERNVTTMVQKKLHAQYFRTERVSSVVLSYQDGDFEMLLFRPEGKATTFSILNALNIDEWQQWQELYETKTNIELYLPKFQFEGDYDLMPTFKKMGIYTAFSDGANFKGISNLKTKISDIKQNTFIAVDEKGTEAAAVTKIGMSLTSMPIEPVDKIEFKLDRSFVFVLREKKNGTICFIGRVMYPKSNNY